MKTKLLFASFAISVFANAQFTKLMDFSGAANGGTPLGDLISDGTFLYGMTQTGGANNEGVIFKIKSDGTAYSDLLDFSGVANGSYPKGSLIYDGTFLYGLTSQGGQHNYGIVFKIKPDGTGFVNLLDFAGVVNGNYPLGSLIYDGTFLYGMTSSGGTNSLGTIFKIKPDGTGYIKLLDFAGVVNGGFPYASLIFDGTFLYGMTTYGGTNSIGVIFKIKPDGTGYLKLLDFAGASNGNQPFGSLVYDGTFLYGTTYSGGANNLGIVFKIKPDGTGCATLIDFAGSANGTSPFGSFISEGNYLYGMTKGGGINNGGVILKIKKDGTGYSKLLDFSSTPDGINPLGSLYSDGIFVYGMTNSGGINNLGTIFKYQDIGMGIYEDNSPINFSIYPNPVSNNLQFLISGLKLNEAEIEILDVNGSSVLQNKFYDLKSTIDVSDLASGIYFLQFRCSNGMVCRKFVKN